MLITLLLGATFAFADNAVQLTQGTSYRSSTTLIGAPAGSLGGYVPSVSDSAVTVNFSNPLRVLSNQWGWDGWDSADTEPGANQILWQSSGNSLSLGFNVNESVLGGALTVFGFNVEPDDWDPHNITVSFMNGDTTIMSWTQYVSGTNGTALFAVDAGKTPITSVNINSDIDFAIGNLRYADAPAATPEPASAILLASGALYFIRRRRHAKK